MDVPNQITVNHQIDKKKQTIKLKIENQKPKKNCIFVYNLLWFLVTIVKSEPNQTECHVILILILLHECLILYSTI